MPFYLENDHINLNLSILARKIIEQDRIIFSASNQSDLTLGSFINKIIKHYDYNQDFQLLQDTLSLKDKGSYFKIRLNKSAIEKIESTSFLENSENICNDFDSNIPTYIKAILESYARVAFIEREKLILKDLIEDIKNAIVRLKSLRITTFTDSISLVSPYKIEASKEETFQYLVCINSDETLHTIRLSQIKKLTAVGNSKKISTACKKELEEKLAEYGATFAANQNVTLKVKFTSKGIASYNYSVIHRPIHKSIEDGNIYTFECSEMQAIYFFFRFASDAEILEPLSLRKKFQELYQAGLAMYK